MLINTRKCDICGKEYSPRYKKMSPYFHDIPFSDTIRLELLEGDTTAIATFKTCSACAGKVFGHIVKMKKEAGNTEVL